MEIFAGLGLFFVGVKLIGSNLKQMTSGWLRKAVSLATESTVRSSVVGLLSGAIAQSSNAITFISISMIVAGLVDVVKTVPMLVWANVGTSALVFLSAIDINFFVFFLLGITGLAFYFDLDAEPEIRHPVGTFLGIGLLFMGIALIKSGSEPLKESIGLKEFLAFAAGNNLLAFGLGAGLTIIAQSSATVSVVVVAMTQVGLLTLEQSVSMVLGSSLGSGLSVALLAMNLSGIGRQVAWLQTIVKLTGVVLILPIVLALKAGLLPLLTGLFQDLDAATLLSGLYFVLQMLAAIIITPLRHPIMMLLCRLSPPTFEEELSRPRFIYDEAVNDPATALDLVRREQIHLFGLLPRLLADARMEEQPVSRTEDLSGSLHSLAQRCDTFLTDVLDRNRSRSALIEAIALEKKQEALLNIMLAIDEFVGVVKVARERSASPAVRSLLFAIRESLDTVLHVAHDAVAGGDESDVHVLAKITEDRSSQMEQVRRSIMQLGNVGPADHHALFASTGLFERTLWLIRQFAPVERRDAPSSGDGLQAGPSVS